MPPPSQGSVSARELDADNEIARRAVPMPARAAVVRRHEAADRRAIGRRGIERNPLPMLGEHSIDLAEPRTALNGGRQVTVTMGHNRVQPRGRHQNVDLAGRSAPAHLRAGAAHEHAQFLARGPFEHAADGFTRRRLDDDARDDAFYGIDRRSKPNGVDPQSETAVSVINVLTIRPVDCGELRVGVLMEITLSPSVTYSRDSSPCSASCTRIRLAI